MVELIFVFAELEEGVLDFFCRICRLIAGRQGY
jgi:hypothetical protein